MSQPDSARDQTAVKRFQRELLTHESTRIENDDLLLASLAQIESGERTETLARFAKAYLGLFLDMDNALPPSERIRVLANEKLAGAVFKGMHQVLRSPLPGAARIADSLSDQKPLDVGYILLAAIHHLGTVEGDDAIVRLPDDTLQAAICFHFANATETADRWLAAVLEQKQQLAAVALNEFWTRLSARGATTLPGLYDLISHQKHDAITAAVLETLLAWPGAKKLILRDILHTAIRLGQKEITSRYCRLALENGNPADHQTYILWLATAYLLDPPTHLARLSAYVDRSKEKILPLLDFTVMVLLTVDAGMLSLDSAALAGLLKLAAPKFTPQLDNYGNLCDNTQKILFLFHRLARCTDSAAQDSMQALSRVRVMKIYHDIIEYCRQIQRQALDIPSQRFIHNLTQAGAIKVKKKWFDGGRR